MYGINLAISLLEGPDTSDHRRQEFALAQKMALALNVILNGGDLEVRIESAKNMIRELKHTYPEAREI